ncbi:S41 family peptidase [Paenibacillus sp. P96]|uniref:S41 family peptidase n=1 Tax=Paenibacillus zeirhizosphaerae TaxID=2987519 RepID=A0ABT9FPZ0_9BACL|nr:S41 family peptidase [Paenibacillus sp. P96]MDP4096492.1 S41 family peptidase [Paenibacillus sp. P96]
MLKKGTAVMLMVIGLLGGSLLTFAYTGYSGGSGSVASEGLLASLTGSAAQKDDLKKIETAMELIEGQYYKDIDRSKLVDGAINGMMEALDDPYSSYMGKETAAQFEESIEGSFTGIGAEVASENGKVVIVTPIKGAPAEKAGLRAQDIILSVNGESLEGLELNDAVSKIRGPKGSEAKIKVQRAGSTDPLEYSIIRDDIDMETVTAHMENDGVGVITITQFSLNTADRFKEELAKLEKQNLKGLVIDVRNNPGGVLSVVIDIAQQFVEKGKTIVQVEDKNQKREKEVSKGSNKPYPVTVLMNKGSASASEILAGALQQSAGATLIGENSFGKGTVQTSYDKQMGDGSLLKITIAKWLTPNGTWIHEKGIKPDIAIPQPEYFTVAPLSKEKSLKYNANNTDVKNAQIMLKGLGYDTGREDGYFDKTTEEAVKSFQKKAGLTVNGVIDTETASKLEAALIENIRDPQNDTQLKRGIEQIRKEMAASVSNSK